jgi:hypothetical protein
MIVYFTNFYAVLIGSFISALSQAFLQNPVGKMATTWFGDKEVIYEAFRSKNSTSININSSTCDYIQKLITFSYREE